MVDAASLAEVALSRAEYDQIVALLGREPNPLELGMFGAMWSEHCGYKNSRPLLKLLPTKGPRVLQGPGENAGAVDIGDGLAVVLKMESHNHPSAVEPFEGAATGVGGILRDIFTMGARPIALLDSLRFGDPADPRTRYLAGGVVAGIAHYGNCVGVPTVGGEIYFHRSYQGNPLVNVMCVGVVRHDRLTRARARGPGNPVILVGADTGRDGIHGATFASVELDESSDQRRPAVQVGNPFLEKLLLEACLELLRSHGDDVVAMQDLGAAGLTSSAVEIAARGGCGIEIDVARVSRRERGMTPYEVMLSESQERMLVVVRQGAEERVRRLFARWGLHSDVVGHITHTNHIVVRDGQQVVADLPLDLLTERVPTYEREGLPPPTAVTLSDLPPLPLPADLGAILLQLLASPNLCSRQPVYRQYDHTVQAATVIGPGEGAAVLRLHGTRRGLALTTDCNSRYCLLEPRLGAALAVAEAARNLVCRGAEPLAITDCLNFGNPERPHVSFALRECILGMAAACRALDVPVVSGNVSLYNESLEGAVNPTPVVGMVGLLEEVERRVPAGFQRAGDVVALIGPWDDALGASEYLAVVHHLEAGPVPSLDLEMERRLQGVVLRLAREGVLASAQDCSEGGLLVALAECCFHRGLGFVGDEAVLRAHLERGRRLDGLLFGEGASRVIVSCAPGNWPRLEAAARAAGVPLARIGVVGGESLRWGTFIDRGVAELRAAWAGGLVGILA